MGSTGLPEKKLGQILLVYIYQRTNLMKFEFLLAFGEQCLNRLHQTGAKQIKSKTGLLLKTQNWIYTKPRREWLEFYVEKKIKPYHLNIFEMVALF